MQVCVGLVRGFMNLTSCIQVLCRLHVGLVQMCIDLRTHR